MKAFKGNKFTLTANHPALIPLGYPLMMTYKELMTALREEMNCARRYFKTARMHKGESFKDDTVYFVTITSGRDKQHSALWQRFIIRRF